jgi:hypothetical protein
MVNLGFSIILLVTLPFFNLYNIRFISRASILVQGQFVTRPNVARSNVAFLNVAHPNVAPRGRMSPLGASNRTYYT